MPFAWPPVAPQPIPTARCMKHGDCARRALDLAKAARFDEARRTFERAITISEAVRGPDDVFVGMLLYDLVGWRPRNARRSRGPSRSNDARLPSSTSHGARATRIRRWRGCGWRSCCFRPGSGSKQKRCSRPRRSSLRRRSEPSTPGLRRASGSQASLRYNARDLDAAERSTAAR